MNIQQISIGHVKRDVSELVNWVAYAGERIALTSRGKPKAVLVSMADYGRLLQSDNRAENIGSPQICGVVAIEIAATRARSLPMQAVFSRRRESVAEFK